MFLIDDVHDRALSSILVVGGFSAKGNANVAKETSRRQFMQAIAVASSTLGVAVASVRGRLFHHQTPLTDAQLDMERRLRAMLMPIQDGSQLVGTVVDAIWLSPKMIGKVRIRDAKTDQVFTIDICRKTPNEASSKAVATTHNYALFLRNGGGGHRVTPEHIGLSLMAVAETLAGHEGRHATLALITDVEHTTLNG